MTDHLPGKPDSRRARGDMLTRLYAQLVGVKGFLASLFFLSRSEADRFDKYAPSTATAEQLCAQLRAYYNQRPRPWRRRADRPRPQRLELGKEYRRLCHPVCLCTDEDIGEGRVRAPKGLHVFKDFDSGIWYRGFRRGLKGAKV